MESDLAIQNWVPGMSVSVKHSDDAFACGSWNTCVEKQVEKCLLNKYKRSPHSCCESLHKTSEVHLNYRRLGSRMEKELPDSEFVFEGDPKSRDVTVTERG